MQSAYSTAPRRLGCWYVRKLIIHKGLNEYTVYSDYVIAYFFSLIHFSHQNLQTSFRDQKASGLQIIHGFLLFLRLSHILLLLGTFHAFLNDIELLTAKDACVSVLSVDFLQHVKQSTEISCCYVITGGFFFILSFFVGYILSFGSVMLRTIRLWAREGAHIVRRCSRSRGENVRITDVIIKNPG